jgi:TonB family protein
MIKKTLSSRIFPLGFVLLALFNALVLPCGLAKTVQRSARTAPAVDNSGQAFCNRVWSKISSKWLLADGNNQVILTCVLDAKGNPQDITIKSSPQCEAAQVSANQAFNDAQPFGPPPALKCSNGEVKVTVTFNSRVDPHGDSSSSGQVRIDPVSR